MRKPMKLQLQEWKKKNQSPEKKQQVKKATPKQEKLSTRDIEDLMGTRRSTYRRHRGAYRQK